MSFFYLLLVLIALYFTYRNILLYKQNKKEKEYIEAFASIFSNDLDLKDVQIDDNDSLYQVKYLLLRMCKELYKGKDISEQLNKLDLKDLFIQNKHFSYERLEKNSDFFVPYLLMMIKDKEVRKSLIQKLDVFASDLCFNIEYLLLKAIDDYLDEKHNPFLDKLLDNDINTLNYDKKMLNMYKMVATTFKAYRKETLVDIDEDNLANFKLTKLGSILFKELGIE